MDDVSNKRIIRIPCSGFKKYELNSLERDASKLFAPFRREGDMLLFDVTNLISICDFLGKNPPIDKYVKVMEELRKSIIVAEEYLLSKEKLCLDPDTIFWNDATEQVCFLYAVPADESPSADDENEEMDRFRLWVISLWHRSVSLDWLNDDLILAIHLTAVVFFDNDELISALSNFLERWNRKKAIEKERKLEFEAAMGAEKTPNPPMKETVKKSNKTLKHPNKAKR